LKTHKQRFDLKFSSFSAVSVAPVLDLTKQFTHLETAPPTLIKLVEAIEQTGKHFCLIECHVKGFIVCGLFVREPDT